jgi:hypothetical protein
MAPLRYANGRREYLFIGYSGSREFNRSSAKKSGVQSLVCKREKPPVKAALRVL